MAGREGIDRDSDREEREEEGEDREEGGIDDPSALSSPALSPSALSSSALSPSAAAALARIRDILTRSRSQALQAVNAAMVRAYWEVGREIVEEEQRGKERADYGTRLIETLAARLTAEFGRGFDGRNLRFMREVYRAFPKWNALRSESSAGLSWTHYRLLARVDRPAARQFYLEECRRARWSTRELERQIASLLYDRYAASRDKAGVLRLAEQGAQAAVPADLMRDPFVVEFTGLAERPLWSEDDLETALMDRLQAFLLELGSDFFFVARQKRLVIDGKAYKVDLVFYHRSLRCFVLIDLKVGALTHGDLGQMLMYVGYYEQEETRSGENPPVGLLLCTELGGEAMVRYTLSGVSQAIFAARYQTHLPTEEQLRSQVTQTRDAFLLEQHLDQHPERHPARDADQESQERQESGEGSNASEGKGA
jgi:predicted nuclease of restriction endonuclease-like (RecB) superfamily